ncbi:MAG: radical SAM protein [Gammaproteobacteria bacterium]|nr:radical SAM protein [Gammaproteobacteria bacterium]
MYLNAPARQINPLHSAAGKPGTSGNAAVSYENARAILTRAGGFLSGYDFTLNPYNGCSFGCTYCYAAFFSRGGFYPDDWGKWVRVKENAVALLEKHKPGSLGGKLIYLSSVTDPYQPLEKKLRLTRALLEALAAHKPKLVVQTRSPMVARDCDVYQRIEQAGGRVQVNMTITTDDENIRRAFEPSCPSNAVRMGAIGQVAQAGVDACITMTPLLLVSNPDGFVKDLSATGVKKFIAQPFHFGKGKFVAQTRAEAVAVMAEKLNCGEAEYQARYLRHYRRVFATLKKSLPNLGEGKDGFAPPF